MSDETITNDPNMTGVSLRKVGNEALDDLSQFTVDMADAIETQATPEKKADALGALGSAVKDLNQMGVAASAPKGGEVKHEDRVKANSKSGLTLTGAAGMALEAGAALTQNPILQTLQLIAKLVASGTKDSLEQLGKIAKDAGVKTVGKNGNSIEDSIAAAQKNKKTLNDIEGMRSHFKGDMIYGPKSRIGKDKDGPKDFVRECAARLRIRDPKDRLEFLEPPVKSKAMDREISAQGIAQPIVTTSRDVHTFTAQARTEERKIEAQVAQPTAATKVDHSLLKRVAQRNNAKYGNLQQLVQAKTSTNLIGEINTIGELNNSGLDNVDPKPKTTSQPQPQPQPQRRVAVIGAGTPPAPSLVPNN